MGHGIPILRAVPQMVWIRPARHDEAGVCKTGDCWRTGSLDRCWLYGIDGETEGPTILLDGYRFHFLEGGLALQDLLNAVLHQGGHAVFNSGLEQILRLGFGLDQPLHLVGSQ